MTPPKDMTNKKLKLIEGQRENWFLKPIKIKEITLTKELMEKAFDKLCNLNRYPRLVEVKKHEIDQRHDG